MIDCKSFSHIPYARQSINDSDIEAVVAALKSPIITRGPLVDKFENRVAAYCGAKYAVAFNSGTSALMAAYYAANLCSNDRVISSPNTFVATVGPAKRYFGAQTIFVDIESNSGNLCLEKLHEQLFQTPSRGRLFVVPVHIAGIPIDMAALDGLVSHPSTVVIEDAAHAIGARYPSGERVGSCAYSRMTVFSFHPAKTMTTGEGGMVTTNSLEDYHCLKFFRDNGVQRNPSHFQESNTDYFEGAYEVQDITGNFHFTEMQAALGLSQFERLPQFIERRKQLVENYRRAFQNQPNITLLRDDRDDIAAFHLFVALFDFEKIGKSRHDVVSFLKEQGIGTQLHYIPLYRHPYFQENSEVLQKELIHCFPNMERYYSQALSLPLFYDLTDREQARVIETIKKVTQTR